MEQFPPLVMPVVHFPDTIALASHWWGLIIEENLPSCCVFQGCFTSSFSVVISDWPETGLLQSTEVCLSHDYGSYEVQGHAEIDILSAPEDGHAIES